MASDRLDTTGVERYDALGSLIQSWGEPGPFEGEFAKPSDIAVDSKGNAVAVWYQYDGTFYRICASRYVSGSDWGTPVYLEANTGSASSPQVAMDSAGGATAVWCQSDGARLNIWANTIR